MRQAGLLDPGARRVSNRCGSLEQRSARDGAAAVGGRQSARISWPAMARGSSMSDNNKEIAYPDVLDLESVVVRSTEEHEAQRTTTPRVLTRVMCWENGMVMA